ncbi:hypothetical protein OG209_40850 (plasmid) [Streptomyces sp. NBC_01383]|uniref:hypothetical protein n=1 Tax=Streptomyces sp. NBC_01383 TaxID=2903846 RepID=UPI002F916245
MIRIVRTRTLKKTDSMVGELRDRAESQRHRADELAAELKVLHPLVEEERQAACDFGESLLLTQDSEERLRKELAAARDDLTHAMGELTALRSQQLLDAEDRVVLRMLLRAARKQEARADRVYVLFRYGRLHSVHTSREAAEIAAEGEGAPRSGWTSQLPGAAMPPADEVTWRVQPLKLGGSQ